jgi:hypothetical protein
MIAGTSPNSTTASTSSRPSRRRNRSRPSRGSEAAVDGPSRGRRRSAGIGAVRDRSMPDRGDADGLVALGELVDDAVGTDAQGAEAPEPAAQRVSGVWLALGQSEGVLDSVDPWQRSFPSGSSERKPAPTGCKLRPKWYPTVVPTRPRGVCRPRPKKTKAPQTQDFRRARPERFELPTFGSVDRRSIQLSYGREAAECSFRRARRRPGRLTCRRAGRR